MQLACVAQTHGRKQSLRGDKTLLVSDAIVQTDGTTFVGAQFAGKGHDNISDETTDLLNKVSKSLLIDFVWSGLGVLTQQRVELAARPDPVPSIQCMSFCCFVPD